MIWGYLQLRKLSYDSTLPCFTTISIKIFTIASHNHLNLSSISVLILSRTFRHTNPSLIHRRVKMIPSPCCQHQRVLPAHATMIHPFTTSPARCHPFSSLVTIISPSLPGPRIPMFAGQTWHVYTLIRIDSIPHSASSIAVFLVKIPNWCWSVKSQVPLFSNPNLCYFKHLFSR